MNNIIKKTILILVIVICVFSVFGCKPNTIPEEKLSEILMKEAQIVTDFMRDTEFRYGDAAINPAINWAELNPEKAIDQKERIVSCDRLVCWILYRAGFTNQPYTQGLTCHPFPEWCESQKFIKITDQTKLEPGDIVFVNPDDQGRPAHVFMCASYMDESGMYLRYDAGSNQRIQCKTGTEATPGQQPFLEYISNFMYAYRPTGEMLNFDYPDVETNFEISYGTPIIDGKIEKDEYKTHYTMDKNTCFAWQGSIDNAKAEIYFAWDDKGLYYAGEISDNTPKYGTTSQPWNTSDCLQLGVNPGKFNETASGMFFIFGAKKNNAVVSYRANFFERIVTSLIPAAAIGHTNGRDTYVIEVLIPWEVMETPITKEFKAEEGAAISLLPCILDYNSNGSINVSYRFKTTDFNPKTYVPATLTK